jgi:hypothetical protein
LQNLSRESYKGITKAIEDANSKLDARIKKGNDEVIYEFNHTIIEIINRISK